MKKNWKSGYFYKPFREKATFKSPVKVWNAQKYVDFCNKVSKLNFRGIILPNFSTVFGHNSKSIKAMISCKTFIESSDNPTSEFGVFNPLDYSEYISDSQNSKKDWQYETQ